MGDFKATFVGVPWWKIIKLDKQSTSNVPTYNIWKNMHDFFALFCSPKDLSQWRKKTFNLGIVNSVQNLGKSTILSLLKCWSLLRKCTVMEWLQGQAWLVTWVRPAWPVPWPHRTTCHPHIKARPRQPLCMPNSEPRQPPCIQWLTHLVPLHLVAW